MDWFRHYHGLVTDPKLHRVSRSAKVSRAVVIAAWCAILEAASQASNRGVAADIDADSLSFLIDERSNTCERVLKALREFGLINDGNEVTKWVKHQPADATASERMRRYRARRAVNGDGPNGGGERHDDRNEDEQLRNERNAPVTQRNSVTTREEQNQTQNTYPPLLSERHPLPPTATVVPFRLAEPEPQERPPKPQRRPPQPKRSLPEGWQPRSEHRHFAQELGLNDEQFWLETEHFINDTSGDKPKYLYADHDRAFKTWLINTRKFGLARPPGHRDHPGGRGPRPDSVSGALAACLARRSGVG